MFFYQVTEYPSEDVFLLNISHGVSINDFKHDSQQTCENHN